jgi:hypothetical protein
MDWNKPMTWNKDNACQCKYSSLSHCSHSRPTVVHRTTNCWRQGKTFNMSLVPPKTKRFLLLASCSSFLELTRSQSSRLSHFPSCCSSWEQIWSIYLPGSHGILPLAHPPGQEQTNQSYTPFQGFSRTEALMSLWKYLMFREYFIKSWGSSIIYEMARLDGASHCTHR